jgi:hypothetical protein
MSVKLSAVLSTVAVLLVLLSPVIQPVKAQQQLPDLVISDIWQNGTTIWYRIQNIGQVSAGSLQVPFSFYNALFVDGQKVAEDNFNLILAAGQQADRSFSYQWQITPPQDVIGVYADYRQQVAESNEQNNYMEETWAAQLPDLIVDRIECGSGNKLSVTVRNIGTAALPTGWTAIADVYFDGSKKGFFSLLNPTSTAGGGIDMTGGSSTYLLSWDITTTVKVRVVVDSGSNITESNEQNNIKEETLQPKLPDLIVDSIQLDTSNRINITIKNIGEADLPSNWAGSADIFFGDSKQGAIDLKNPTGVINGGIEKAGGISLYILPWTITATTSVTMVADSTNAIAESNEQNNAKKEALTPTITTTKITTTTTMTQTTTATAIISTPITTATATTQTAPSPKFSITSGPKVSDVTQSSVVIIWETSLPGDSTVKYGDRAEKYGNTFRDSKLTEEHQLTLTDLKPGTAYRFVVVSQDAAGRIVKSRTFSFETLAASDNEKPTLSLIVPDILSGKVTLSVEAQDNIGIDRVVFFCDGKAMCTDYSFPFACPLDTAILDEGEHTFYAQAFDAFGNRGEASKRGSVRYPIINPTAPDITIINPAYGDTVDGSVNIESLIEDAEGYVKKAEMYIDGVLVKRWVYTPYSYSLDLSGGDFEIVYNLVRCSLSFGHLWDTTGLGFNSEHLIEVRAWDDANNYNYASIKVRRPTLEYVSPDVTFVLPEIITVQVTRDVVTGAGGNWFEVWLHVSNTGNTPLSNLQIRDACVGFQAIPLSADTTVDYDPLYKESHITIIPTMGELRPGEMWTFVYHIVPILFSPGNPMDNGEYVIGLSRMGWRPQVVLSVINGGGVYQYLIEQPYTPAYEDSDGDGLNDLDAAFKSADYLIVTSEVLLNNSDYAGVDLLLQKVATLAREKRGILAFWYPSPYNYESWQYAYTTLKDYISPGVPNPANYYHGYWASRLSDVFSHPDTQDAYLLLIGEWEVIPSATYDVSSYGINWSDGDHTNEVPLSDNFYADTIGNDKVPDLIVGRILGETPGIMTKAIQASLDAMVGAGFDRASAVVASGYEGDSGDSFYPNAIDAAADLGEQGVRNELLHWDMFVEQCWELPLNHYDAFALGDIDGDGIDEVIIAKDEEDKIYIYESDDGSPVTEFNCEFGQYDALATGDLKGYGSDLIVIASVDDGRLYVYEPNGTLITSYYVAFDDWWAIAIGNTDIALMGEEIIVASRNSNDIHVYHLQDRSIWRLPGWEIADAGYFRIAEEFTVFDSLAVGNVMGDATSADEILIARDDDDKIYIHNPDGSLVDRIDARFTHYDGFAVGDVDDDGMDEMVVVIDEDNKLYLYQDNGRYLDSDGDRQWRQTKMYSRYFDSWFNGIRYTAGDTRYDGIAIGNVIPGENGKLCIVHITDESWDDFYVLSSNWGDADRWANIRLGYLAADISFLVISGHGNSGGPSPIISSCAGEWGDFTQHPVVFSMSCLTGYYRGWTFGDSLFDHGAAVFIGSTEVSAGTQNNETIRNYFDTDFGHYWNIYGSVAGKGFRDYERYRTTQGNWWKFWVYEYNYYGDPKFPFGG